MNRRVSYRIQPRTGRRASESLSERRDRVQVSCLQQELELAEEREEADKATTLADSIPFQNLMRQVLWMSPFFFEARLERNPENMKRKENPA